MSANYETAKQQSLSYLTDRLQEQEETLQAMQQHNRCLEETVAYLHASNKTLMLRPSLTLTTLRNHSWNPQQRSINSKRHQELQDKILLLEAQLSAMKTDLMTTKKSESNIKDKIKSLFSHTRTLISLVRYHEDQKYAKNKHIPLARIGLQQSTEDITNHSAKKRKIPLRDILQDLYKVVHPDKQLSFDKLQVTLIQKFLSQQAESTLNTTSLFAVDQDQVTGNPEQALSKRIAPEFLSIERAQNSWSTHALRLHFPSDSFVPQASQAEALRPLTVMNEEPASATISHAVVQDQHVVGDQQHSESQPNTSSQEEPHSNQNQRLQMLASSPDLPLFFDEIRNLPFKEFEEIHHIIRDSLGMK